MARSLAACALPALVICASWLQLEDPGRTAEGFAIAALALAPVTVPGGWCRRAVVAASSAAGAWIAFGAQPWELAPFRDERILGPVTSAVGRGIADFYAVVLPLDPEGYVEMHSLVLCAIFGFTLALGLFVAARRPVAAAAVTVGGAGWPATLSGEQAMLIGALALASALSIPLILRARSGPALLAGGAAAALVVLAATSVSSATTLARESMLNWETWDLRRVAGQATTVRMVWDSQYDGIAFPATKTVVLKIEGPREAQYWRASTLDLFTADRWLEDLPWLGSALVEGNVKPLAPGRLLPARGLRPENWLEQRVRVEALVDDHLVAAGTPVALDARRLGTVVPLPGGVLRARDPLGEGKSYRVWSYAPHPAPSALTASPPRYPAEAARFLAIDGRHFPAFGERGRRKAVQALFAERFGDPFAGPFADTLAQHRPMYAIAQRIAGDARSPYAAVLALEAWFRQRGGFRYDESPPRIRTAPLVAFVTRTRAGYCQHFAGAMAAMLRMLGVPARVAVGFTSGTKDEGRTWVVTDHEAHAWVEVWFAGVGWVPFDPTPGRGRFAGEYSFASDSEEALAALGRGDLTRTERPPGRERLAAADLAGEGGLANGRAPSLLAGVLLLSVLWGLGVGIGKAGLRRARYLTRDPRRSGTASRLELEAFLRDQRVSIAPGATLQALQRAVYDELGVDGRPFATAAACARFGPPAQAGTGAILARRELRLLLKLARRELSFWARCRGFVSLRSLRGSATP